MNRTRALLGLLIALASTASAGVMAEVAIIVHPSNANASLSEMQFTRIYLGRLDTFPDGSAAVAINQQPDSATRQQMESDMLHKSPAQMRAYWTKLTFTGEGTPPEEVDGGAAMVARVAGDPNAIGYVDAAEVTDTVKVIAVQ